MWAQSWGTESLQYRKLVLKSEQEFCNIILLKCFDSLHFYFELLSTKCLLHLKCWLVKHLLPNTSLAFNSLANSGIPFSNLIKTTSLNQWQSRSEEASCKSLNQTKGIWPDTTNSLSLMAATVPCSAVLLGDQPVEGTVALF